MADPPRLCILIVDDHADSLHLLQRILVMQRHEVRACPTASEALAALQCDGAVRYDLLICDLALPDGDGNDIMRQAARLGIPGIAVSALAGLKDHARSSAAGFTAHLDKPFLFDDLAAAIDRVACRQLAR